MNSIRWTNLLVGFLTALVLSGTSCRPAIDDNAPDPAASPTGAAGGDLGGTYPNPTIANGAVTPAKLSQAYLPLAGGTLSGALVLAGAPSSGSHAATKTYADSYIAGLSVNTSGLASISNGQALTWDAANSRWTPTTVTGGANATQIQGATVDVTGLATNHTLRYDGTNWVVGTLPVASGGTGAATLTANGILVGNGTTAISASTLTSGQLLIGSTGAAPVATTITGTANQVVVTNGAGSVTLSTPQSINTTSAPTFAGATLSAALNMSSQLINAVATPVATTDAANKAYVDAGNNVINSVTTNAGIYSNQIQSVTPTVAYAEVCFKGGATQVDTHAASASTAGGNCVAGDIGFIIERDERATQYWELAKVTCLQLGMRLTEPFEWKYACKILNVTDGTVTTFLNAMKDNWEWVGNTLTMEYPAAVYFAGWMMGNGSCSWGSWNTMADNSGNENTVPFRCGL